MFNKKDYLEYFKQLYEVEIDMKSNVEKLLKIVEHPESRKILEGIRSDEIRHSRIVKNMIKLINE